MAVLGGGSCVTNSLCGSMRGFSVLSYLMPSGRVLMGHVWHFDHLVGTREPLVTLLLVLPLHINCQSHCFTLSFEQAAIMQTVVLFFHC